MSKKEFLEKHNLTEEDYKNLERYERVRKGGSMNMFEYMGLMKRQNANGGAKLVSFILHHYGDFLETLKGGK